MKKLSNEKRLSLEMDVCRTVIRDALAAGYHIRIFDGEEWTTNGPITNDHQLMKDLRSTDEDMVYFYKPENKPDQGRWIPNGFVHFVYGNMPYEVIADNTDSDEINNLLKNAEALQEAFEKDLT